MKRRILTLVLAAAVMMASLILGDGMLNKYHLPGNQQGFEPVQPIAYSHRLHAGELSIPCLYCHFGAEKSRTAGIPPANVCMNCHRFVTAPFDVVKAEDAAATKENRKPRRIVSAELVKLYDALGVDSSMTHRPGAPMRPIEWVRVHRLPDYVYFDHRPHVNAGVPCQQCHGEVQTMERVRQVSDLTMGWCVNCHRDANARGVNGKPVNASTDCSTCHF